MDEVASMDATAKVFENVITKHGFKITRVCYEANGRVGNNLLKDMFWKLWDLGDSSADNREQFWPKVDLLLDIIDKS